MATLVPVILALVPLLILPGWLFFFDVTPKAAVLLFGSSIALLFLRRNASAVAALLATKEGKWLAILLGAELVSIILATVFSTNPAISFGGTNWRRFGLVAQSSAVLFALLLAAHCATDKRVARRALQATAIAGCLAAIYAILQYFGWDPLLPQDLYEAGEGEFRIVRPPSTAGHASYLATYLLFALFAAIAAGDRNRVFTSLACVVIPTGILLSGTRAALLGLAAGLVLYVARRRPKWQYVAAICALATLALVTFSISPAGERLRARIHWALEDTRGGSRLLLWRDSLRMAADRPLMGTGLETFSAQFPAYQSVELSRAFPDFYSESPHNILLDALTSQGLAGLMVLLGLCAFAAVHGRAHPAVAAGVLAGLVSLQFTSFTLVTFLAFLSFIAILAGGSAAAVVPEPRRVWRPAPILSSVILAICGLRLTISDWHLQRAGQELDAGRPAAALAPYRRSILWSLPGASADLYYSRRMAAFAHWPEALEWGERATRTSEDTHNAWYSLAAIQAAVNDGVGVERSLTNAIRLAPNWFKPHWTLAQLFASQGRIAEAEKEAAIAVRLSASKYPDVLETLEDIQRLR